MTFARIVRLGGWDDMDIGTAIIVDGIEVKCYPDNDGRSWYYHPTTGKVVYVD